MTKKQRILIVEDEEALAAGLEYGLVREGYDVVLERDGEAGLRRARGGDFDLIVSDVMMPKRSGFDLVRILRDEGHATPLILLTAKGQEADKLRGFDLGADDYVTKPFSLAELVARVRARIRRAPAAAQAVPDVIEIGAARVDLAALRVERDGRALDLTVKEADMLRLLWRERGRPVERRRFLVEVWKLERFSGTRTVDQHMVKLRVKVEGDGERPRHIVTVHGVGYRLDA
jgi:DNA-binding response OmpR family regulator